MIIYFSIFDGFFDISLLRESDSLLENITKNILKNFHTLKDEFIYTSQKQLQNDIQKMLYRLSIGDRKHYSLYKNINRFSGMEAYKFLFEEGIIQKEISREKPIEKKPNQPLKKELRGYQIEDKLHFSKEFHRFWWTFIYPHYDALDKCEYNETLEDIEKNLGYFVSSFFEELSNALIADLFQEEIVEFGGYWAKDIEIDLLAKLKDGTLIAGECKWKNHKVNKSILNKLINVTQKAGFEAKYYALFSKSGFSKELESMQGDEVLLFDLESFRRLLDDR